MADVGNTPLVKVDGIYAKMECTNPMGSIKDRLAKYIIEESERQGLLKPGMEIIEASSGNTGIALAYFAREKGYPLTIIMPENMSEERKNVIRVLGAKMVLCSEGDFAEAAVIRDRMVASDPNCFNPDQFSNPLNVDCHYYTTAEEVLGQMSSYTDRIDAFVTGMGTVSTREALDAAQYLADERGLCVGISSGANYLVARRVAETRGTTVTVFPDGLSKYRSMGLKARGPCLVDRQCKCPIREVCGKDGGGEACAIVDTDC